MADSGSQFSTAKRSPIVVRMGDKHWNVQTTSASTTAIEEPVAQTNHVIGGGGPQTVVTKSIPVHRTPKRRFARRRTRRDPFMRLAVAIVSHIFQTLFPKRSNMWAAGLQGGLIVGMLFGCLAMFLFHQMAPLPVPSSQAPTDSASYSLPVSSDAPHKLVNIPGLEFYAVTCGQFSTQSAATAQAKALEKQGVHAVVVPWKGYSLFAGVAMTEGDADNLAKSLQNTVKSSSVQSVNVTAHALPILGTMDASGIHAIERWLSDSSSALRSTTALLSDGGRVADAQTALQTALDAYPGDTVLSETGISDELAQINSGLHRADGDFQKQNKAALMEDIEQVFVEIATMHGITTGT